jgi:hypothetical protein
MKRKLAIVGLIAAALLAAWYCFFIISQIQLLNISDTSNVIISLERIEILGGCPSYKLTVYGDGRVEYEWRGSVEITGKQTAYIPREKVKELVREFYKIRYFLLHKEYTYVGCFLFGESVTDAPTTITSISVGGKRQEVLDYYGAPAKLKDLEAKIDEVAGSDRWVKGAE